MTIIMKKIPLCVISDASLTCAQGTAGSSDLAGPEADSALRVGALFTHLPFCDFDRNMYIG